jgi:hypothetical protein
MDKRMKAAIASYGRSVLSAAAALYLAGVTDPLDLVWSLPVAIRFINPNDTAFGRGPKPEEIAAALAAATPKKAPTKKTTPKK